METVKTYLIRKPKNLEEVINMSKAHPDRAECVKIIEKMEITREEYEKICNNPCAHNFDFLKDKGGYDNSNTRQVIALTCDNNRTLYTDPSGYSYCRYLGV